MNTQASHIQCVYLNLEHKELMFLLSNVALSLYLFKTSVRESSSKSNMRSIELEVKHKVIIKHEGGKSVNDFAHDLGMLLLCTASPYSIWYNFSKSLEYHTVMWS